MRAGHRRRLEAELQMFCPAPFGVFGGANQQPGAQGVARAHGVGDPYLDGGQIGPARRVIQARSVFSPRDHDGRVRIKAAQRSQGVLFVARKEEVQILVAEFEQVGLPPPPLPAPPGNLGGCG